MFIGFEKYIIEISFIDDIFHSYEFRKQDYFRIFILILQNLSDEIQGKT